MNAELSLHQAVIATLRADVALGALLAAHSYATPPCPAVYDYAPQVAHPEDSGAFPYVVVGDTNAIDFDTDDRDGHEFTVTLHVWDHYRGSKRAREVMDAVYGALHRKDLQVAGQHTVYCYWEFSGAVPDTEPLVQHYATRFRIVVQAIVV